MMGSKKEMSETDEVVILGGSGQVLSVGTEVYKAVTSSYDFTRGKYKGDVESVFFSRKGVVVAVYPKRFSIRVRWEKSGLTEEFSSSIPEKSRPTTDSLLTKEWFSKLVGGLIVDEIYDNESTIKNCNDLIRVLRDSLVQVSAIEQSYKPPKNLVPKKKK